MELTGKIKLITDQQNFDSGFYKREFVITTDEQYPQDIKFEAFKEKCEMLNGLSEGTNVRVSFDIRGREWQGKYFNNLVAWRIESMSEAAGGTPPPPPPFEEPGNFPAADAPVNADKMEEDDLPF